MQEPIVDNDYLEAGLVDVFHYVRWQFKSIYRCYYYGGLSASDNPNLYTECIRTCLQDYWNLQEKHESKLPLVVNTMGWIEGP